MGARLLRIFARSQGLFFRDGPVAGGAATKLRPPRGGRRRGARSAIAVFEQQSGSSGGVGSPREDLGRKRRGSVATRLCLPCTLVGSAERHLEATQRKTVRTVVAVLRSEPAVAEAQVVGIGTRNGRRPTVPVGADVTHCPKTFIIPRIAVARGRVPLGTRKLEFYHRSFVAGYVGRFAGLPGEKFNRETPAKHPIGMLTGSVG